MERRLAAIAALTIAAGGVAVYLETLCFEFLVDEVLDALFSKDSGRVSPTTQRQKEYFRELQALAIQVLSEYADSEHAGQHLSAAKRSELRVALSGRGLLEQPSIH